MKIHTTYIIIGMIIALAAFFGLIAHADELKQTTLLTFSQPVEIPGQVLPAGTYVFRLANSDFEQDIVQILSSDQIHLLATFQTVPAQRPASTDHTALTLAEQGSGAPDVLLQWFYPGSLTGHEFVYPKAQERKIAHEKHVIEVNPQSTSKSQPTGLGN